MNTLPPPDDRLQEPPEQQTHQVSILLRRVSPKVWTEEWANDLESVDPIPFDTIMSEFATIHKKYLWYSVRNNSLFVLFNIVLAVFLEILLTSSHARNIVLSVLSTGGILLFNSNFSKRTNKDLLKWKYLKVEDLRCIGSLADMLRKESLSHYRTRFAVGVLPPLLRHLRTGDETCLDEAQRRGLYRFLQPALALRERQLALAILYALKQIGDSAALGPVSRLAAAAETDSELKSSAEQCVQILKQRAEQHRVSETLLRASNEPETTPAILLRAAYSGIESPAEQLLRSTNNGSASGSDSPFES